MRLLVVGMHNSPHLHRWVEMIARPDVPIVLFPVLAFETSLPDGFQTIALADIGSDLSPGIWVVRPLDARNPEADKVDQECGYRPLTHHFIEPAILSSADRLAYCISRFRPHIVHGMETQIAGYLCAETARRIGARFPRWIQSTWGSDMFLYGRMPGHSDRIRGVFERVQVHLADCNRDRLLARGYGYKGPNMPVIPSSGGIDVQDAHLLATIPPSRRRKIAVKGYHNWAGRALLALSALMLAADGLRDYDIEIFASDASSAEWAEDLIHRSGLQVAIAPYLPSHRDALARLAEARIVISLSISDGLATTALEAMTVGTFPIQSRAGCAGEWFGNTGGFIVEPYDTRGVADAIVRAATDDQLVDSAAEQNFETVRRRWNIATNAALAWKIYDAAIGLE